MGTKNHPGQFDCYAIAEDDEPIFTLLGRDPEAPSLVRRWARRADRNRTATPEKVAEARKCAKAMEIWYHRDKGEDYARND